MNTWVMTAEINKERISEPVEQSPRHYRNGLIFTGLLLLLLGWGLVHMLDPTTLPIRHVSIKGEFRHLAPAVMEEMVADVVRGGFFNVNVDVIQKTLLAEPWVKSVGVRRVWPDAITVHVEEQVPVVRWGDSGLLNEKAEYFAPTPETFPQGLPVLAGPENSYALLLNNFNRAREILAPIGLDVITMRVSERRAWEIRLSNELSLILGRDNVMKRLERFAKYVPGQLANRLDEIDYVDMRYTNGFSVRWKNNAQPVAQELENNAQKSR